jgi:hypothetical protein
LAILGPEIAKRRAAGAVNSQGGFAAGREARSGSGTTIADAPTASGSDPDMPSSETSSGLAIDLTVADQSPSERRQTERRNDEADVPADADRRTPADRRNSNDRRATLSERDRRLTPAGRHALNLVAAASENPVPLTGDGGLLTALVTDILQRGLEVEIAGHLGHGRWESGARGADNIRNGAYGKRVITDLGAVKVQMPRDRRGTFEPVIVPKHGRRLLAPAANVAGVYASGMTRAEIRSQLDNVTQSRLDRETVDAFTDELEPEIRAWQRRRFESSYPVLLIDSITLSGRGTRTTKRALDVAVGIDAYGDYELLGLWRRPSRSSQGPGRWAPMMDELHYRGISAIEFICTAGDEDLTDAADSVFPLAKVRHGVDALIQNTLRFYD